MQVRIGMTYSSKELEIELGDAQDGDAVVAEITKAVAEDGGMLWLTDRKGRRVGVASAKVAYVEVGPDSEGRRVGFSAL
ncbi:MAG: DUF3107 domain-containing protein [Acidimicrobiales bacterium]|nr:DUF3107 domain-containing protein [Actinomycetota bacterium]